MSLKNYIKTIGFGITVITLSACITDLGKISKVESAERVCDSCTKTAGATVYTPIGPVDIEPADPVVQCYGYKWQYSNGETGKQHYSTFNACTTSQNQTAIAHEITSACSLKSPCSSF